MKKEKKKNKYLLTGFISVLCKSDHNCTNSKYKNYDFIVKYTSEKLNTNKKKTSWKLVLNLPKKWEGVSYYQNESGGFFYIYIRITQKKNKQTKIIYERQV